MSALAPGPGSSTIVLPIGDPITRADVPRLCERLRVLLEDSDADVAICDAAALTTFDVATVDALARMQLTALRLGRSIRLRHASSELRELLAIAGLSSVISQCSRLGCGRQTEEREQARGVEERVQPDDPTG
ncbi:MAG: STAS domain-containing protein [Streptosporangiaceae bacterium]